MHSYQLHWGMQFLVDILKSRLNECFDNFSKDLQVMIKDLDKM